MLKSNVRYLQIAFNDDLKTVGYILPKIPRSDRILIEAGTPLIKKFGDSSIRFIRSLWPGIVVADLKTMDGALDEVKLAYNAGANAATVLGSSSVETIDLFIKACSNLGLCSMIDMLGVDDPLKILLKLKKPPDVVILHKGRDEETTKGKVIKYKHINRILSKFDVFISVAGGINLREARSAIFNGADIVIANVVNPDDPWTGILANEDVSKIAQEFLDTIE